MQRTALAPMHHERGQLRLMCRDRGEAATATHRANLPHLQLRDARRRPLPYLEESARARRREDLARDLACGATLLRADPGALVAAVAAAGTYLAAAPRRAQRWRTRGSLPLAAASRVVPGRLAPHTLGLAILARVKGQGEGSRSGSGPELVVWGRGQGQS